MNYTFLLYRGSEIFTGTYTNLIHMKESIYYIYELHLKYYIHCCQTFNTFSPSNISCEKSLTTNNPEI